MFDSDERKRDNEIQSCETFDCDSIRNSRTIYVLHTPRDEPFDYIYIYNTFLLITLSVENDRERVESAENWRLKCGVEIFFLIGFLYSTTKKVRNT